MHLADSLTASHSQLLLRKLCVICSCVAFPTIAARAVCKPHMWTPPTSQAYIHLTQNYSKCDKVNVYTDLLYVSRRVMRWSGSAAEQNSWSWIMVNNILDWRLLEALFCSTASVRRQLLSDIAPSSGWYLRLFTVPLHIVQRFKAHSKNHLFNLFLSFYKVQHLVLAGIEMHNI